ncbi:MAG TPA: heavy metal translocating P-type ATPase, partial [Dehalococcoidia bacterium]|nr:heavy metal translocating P-type ATPase [Dehalococcoidia bacterium]
MADERRPASEHGRHGGQRGGHQGRSEHAGHEVMFRNRFLVCLALSIPALVYSPAIQEWLNFTVPAFSGSQWVTPGLGIIIFAYGGIPFLKMVPGEVQKKQPGMMTLISLAISVAFIYSLIALVSGLGEGFFWELVTLIDVMLLGHWIEMRSVRQASGALN